VFAFTALREIIKLQFGIFCDNHANTGRKPIFSEGYTTKIKERFI
jgi:hypothetical protein